MTQVISLDQAREAKKIREGDPRYQAQLEQMDKLELLEEMMRFQTERTNSGKLTIKLIVRGQILFKILEAQAETHELRDLSKTYCRHLKLELDAYLKAQKSPGQRRPGQKRS